MKGRKTHILKAIVIIGFSLLSGLNIAAAENADFTIHSKILNEVRDIKVYLPENYDEHSKVGYNVIYMLDAGNDDALVAHTVNKLSAKELAPSSIVVAITNIRRLYDFTPPHAQFQGKKGNAQQFLTFIESELIEETNKRFMTNKQKIFMGHSAGGSFSTYLLSQSPGLFDGYFIFSPAIGTSNELTFSSMSLNFENTAKLPEFIYVSVGTDEENWFKDSYKSLVEYLAQEAPSKIRLKFEITENAVHMSNPEKSLENAMKFAWQAKTAVKTR